ncbi:2,3-diketo-5-methylthio-1-phosphopentane enolase [Cavenderia fasciculata]|uniref:2,3-diketo-5-methylthio-1-phosphopentane enolase n=1 Tax=Cavenderia fasciculata TaxID=261658 RepID=F4PVV5_CACFS|nr:2,3-diketo-5-methylthio-1-phosphopentane enolase [Cavenderia fasciculata]EGG20119.1 2,3-diketo-5-methylthio-1-phosphopentane enolase [Cavenderia fasciculata]|eukprot:XP_004367102.1 2,3-diketo-5-methylthio-1-phosphopentane enolase [Cavenderia fasciculata]
MSFITERWGSQPIVDDVNALYRLYRDDKSSGVDHIVGQKGVLTLDRLPAILDPSDPTSSQQDKIQSVYDNCIALLDIDRKATPFKQLQGTLFKEAFESDVLRGQVYPDVFESVDLWTQSNASVYIYSSGSIAAQKLLFGNCGPTTQADQKQQAAINLLPKFKGHFDTTIGSKIESTSYTNIINQIDSATADTTLFVTDSQKEALAASQSNLNVAISIRPGNTPLDESLTQQIKSINPSVSTITSFIDLFNHYTFQQQ